MTNHGFLTAFGRTLVSTVLALILLPGSWAIKSGKEYRFKNVPDGAFPVGGLVSDGAGNFYGTTTAGGFNTCGGSTPFCGTVFQLSQQQGGWKESVIYNFKGSSDGASPSGNLVFDAKGNLYGTTVLGGSDQCVEGCGTVFKLSNQNGSWTESVLYSFLGGADAEEPGSGVVIDKAGNLYGAAGGGCIEECSGTIFKLTAGPGGTWTESVLYTFLGGTDGGFPNSVILDTAGNIFGTTFSGGVTQSPCGGCGTVFELSFSEKGGWTKNILYNFNDGLDGGDPSSGVVLDKAGNLYGETYDGGSFACPEVGCGVVYELIKESGSWKFSVANTFNGMDGSKGSQPSGGLAIDTAGNLYGTTGTGGDAACNNGNGCGTVFKLSPKTGGGFSYSMIGAFNGTDGSSPNGGVIVDGAGNLYGTSYDGGNAGCNCGVVFAVTP